MCCDGGAFFVQPSQVKACDSIIVANCGRLLDMPSTNAESPLLARGFAGFCPEASRIAEHHDREQRLGSHGFRRILPSPVKVRVMIVDQMFEANPVSQPIVHIEVHARRSSSSPCSLCSSSSSAMMQAHNHVLRPTPLCHGPRAFAEVRRLGSYATGPVRWSVRPKQ